VKSTRFPYCNMHKHTQASPDGVTHNQIYHVLTDKDNIQIYEMSDPLEELTDIDH
jgi:hypothetical protein